MQKYISVEQKHIGVQNDNETVIYIFLALIKNIYFIENRKKKTTLHCCKMVFFFAV